jgi:hypothetical protein
MIPKGQYLLAVKMIRSTGAAVDALEVFEPVEGGGPCIAIGTVSLAARGQNVTAQVLAPAQRPEPGQEWNADTIWAGIDSAAAEVRKKIESQIQVVRSLPIGNGS